MSRPKMVSASKGGGGGPGRPEQSLHPSWARVSVRARAGLGLAPWPPRASRSVPSRGVWGGGCGALGGEGRRSELGRTPVVSPLLRFRAPNPLGSPGPRGAVRRRPEGRCEREAPHASVSPLASPVYTPPLPRSDGRAPGAGPRQMAGT